MPLPVSDGIVRTERDMAGIPDLTDDEIQRMFATMVDINNRYMHKQTTPENLQAMEDEIKTRMADQGILVSVDPAPILYGEPPIVDIVGKVSTDPIHKYGFDHEHKSHDVNKANQRGEAWLGQKGRSA